MAEVEPLNNTLSGRDTGGLLSLGQFGITSPPYLLVSYEIGGPGGVDPADFIGFDAAPSLLTIEARIDLSDGWLTQYNAGGVTGATRTVTIAPALGLTGPVGVVTERVGATAYGTAYNNAFGALTNAINTATAAYNDSMGGAFYLDPGLLADINAMQQARTFADALYERTLVNAVGVVVGGDLNGVLGTYAGNTPFWTTGATAIGTLATIANTWDVSVITKTLDSVTQTTLGDVLSWAMNVTGGGGGGGATLPIAVQVTGGRLAFGPLYGSPFEPGSAQFDQPLGDSLIQAATASNLPPFFTSLTSVVVPENIAGIAYQAAATDPEGQPLTYSLSGTDAGLFTIDAATGAVSFLTPPNFEAPADAGGNNVYDILVNVTDGVNPRELLVAITVANVNEPPVFLGEPTAPFPENATGVAYQAEAVDPEGSLVLYSLSGVDAARFSINALTGAVSFLTPPNFEAPTDAGGNNVYDVIVTASDSLVSADYDVQITVTNVNEAPVFTSPPAVNFAENGAGIAYQAAAVDPESTPLTYSLSGTDAGRFSINGATGAVSFLTQPNFEAPTDAGGNNVYDIVVTASEGVNATPYAVAVTVTNVNEAPVFTSPPAATFAENGAGVAYLAAAVDPESTPLTYSLSGTDAGRFSINSATGAVSFLTPPNFEAPADAGGNNVYDIVVTASDGVNATPYAVAVTVTNVNEAPVFTSPPAATFAENGEGIAYQATAVDPEGSTVTYSVTGADAVHFREIPLIQIINGIPTQIFGSSGQIAFQTPPNFEAPTDAGGNNIYDIVVTASDGVTGTPYAVAVTVTNVNEAPAILSGPGGTFFENVTGPVYQASSGDPDSPALTYSLAGPDAARFTINAGTGAVSFVAPPDFEAPGDADGDNIYVLDVRASDGEFTASRPVSIRILDVDETPITFSLTSTYLGEVGETGVYRIALGDIGLADVTSITIADDAAVSGGTGRASGFDLDFVRLTSVFTNAPADGAVAPTRPGLNFTPAGVAFQPGTLTPFVAGGNASWVGSTLFGTTPDGVSVNFPMASLGTRDGQNAIEGGSLALGEGGRITFTLDPASAASGAFLYVGETGGANERLTVTATVTGQQRTGLKLNGTAIGDDIRLGEGLHVGLGAGHDSLAGGGGADALGGAAGNDTLAGGAGADSLLGGAGLDIADYGGDPGGLYIDLGGGVAVDGSGAVDVLVSIEGAIGTSTGFFSADWSDAMIGSAGGDLFFGRGGKDYVAAGAGGDLVHGEDGDDALFGAAGDDALFGGDGVDYLDGGEGNDTLDAGASLGAGYDYANGGAGADVLVKSGIGRFYAEGGAGADLLIGGDATAPAGEAADFLIGGAGADTLLGGAGGDVLIAASYEAGVAAGTDAGVIDLALGGSGDDFVLQGLFGRGDLRGDDGADTIVGGALSDTIVFGRGDDVAFGLGGADVFAVFADDLGNDARDSILDFTSEDRLFLGGIGAGQVLFGEMAGGAVAVIALSGGGSHFVAALGATPAQLQAQTIFG